MENGHIINGTSTADDFLMTHLDQREDSRSSDDIIARRLKNRERQRRYRARKRQEADMKKVCEISISTPPSVEESQVNDIPNDFVSSIYCKRDWKKDARRAHTFKEQEASSYYPEATPQVPTEIQSSGSLIMVNAEACTSTPSTRNWKADARKKKNLAC